MQKCISSNNELNTWSCLAFTPFTGHQNLNDLDMSILAWFTTVGGGTGGGIGVKKKKKSKLNKVCVLQPR